MSKRQKTELTVDEVIGAISGEARDEDVPFIVYMSGYAHSSRRISDALVDRLNHPDIVSRICDKFGWHWVAFGRDGPVERPYHELYCVAHKGPGKPSPPAVDWDRLISSITANYSDMFERARRERVTFRVHSDDALIHDTRHFPQELLEKRLPHLSITAMDWDSVLILIAGPKGSLGSE